MAIVAGLVFGVTFALSAWAIWSTVRPNFARIVDLLANGPVPSLSLPAPVPARSSLRNVRMRSVSGRLPLRAAA